jgi:hypothetical protein
VTTGDRVYDGPVFAISKIQTHAGTLTTPYSASSDETVRCDTTAGNVRVAMPQASSAPGRTIWIRITAGANSVDTIPNGSDTVNGLAAGDGPGIGPPYTTGQLMSDGISDWMLMSFV